jgi:hypothetical protein
MPPKQLSKQDYEKVTGPITEAEYLKLTQGPKSGPNDRTMRAPGDYEGAEVRRGPATYQMPASVDGQPTGGHYTVSSPEDADRLHAKFGSGAVADKDYERARAELGGPLYKPVPQFKAEAANSAYRYSASNGHTYVVSGPQDFLRLERAGVIDPSESSHAIKQYQAWQGTADPVSHAPRFEAKPGDAPMPAVTPTSLSGQKPKHPEVPKMGPMPAPSKSTSPYLPHAPAPEPTMKAGESLQGSASVPGPYQQADIHGGTSPAAAQASDARARWEAELGRPVSEEELARLRSGRPMGYEREAGLPSTAKSYATTGAKGAVDVMQTAAAAARDYEPEKPADPQDNPAAYWDQVKLAAALKAKKSK